MIWKIDLEGRFLIEYFEGESIVYDRFSGATHLLDFVSSSVLSSLASEPKSNAEISKYLESDHEFSDKKILMVILEQHLKSLESYGFISKAVDDDTCRIR